MICKLLERAILSEKKLICTALFPLLVSHVAPECLFYSELNCVDACGRQLYEKLRDIYVIIRDLMFEKC